MEQSTLERIPKVESQRRWERPLLVLLAAACALVLSLCRDPGGDINYYNSDATWHVLMTMECYDETPASVHHFLPIVTMGEPGDKGIPWGATVPDRQGNYYYTSFSPAEFALPYFFVKLFHLPIAENSLHLFNGLLFLASASLFALLVWEVFRQERYRLFLAGTAAAAYLCAPELLHGMGVVYWAQSVMQLTLLIQLYAYYRWVEYGSRRAYVLFLAMCLANPYIEWTGYVANGGYMLCELARGRRDLLRAAGRFLLPGAVTILSFLLFSLHFMSVLSPEAYADALVGRFVVRSALTADPLGKVFLGYLSSFLFLWPLLAVLLVGVTVCWRGFGWVRESLLLRKGWLLFVAAVPLLENIIMKQHAITYTYDRMKLIFPLALVLCDLCRLCLKRVEKRMLLCGLVLAASLANVCSYVGNEAYIWPAAYRADNRTLADAVSRYEGDSVMGSTAYAGRCIYLDFQRGVYEYTDLEALRPIAEEQGKRYVLLLTFGENASTSWGMPAYDNIRVLDRDSGGVTELRVVDGQVTETALNMQ